MTDGTRVVNPGGDRLTRVCPSCGYDGKDNGGLILCHRIEPGKPPHGDQIRCGDCGRHLGYVPKEKKETPKRPSNEGHRIEWRARMGGRLRCGICGVLEADNSEVGFDIDHIWQIEDGGPEREVGNTMPICRDCHRIKNAVRALRRHASGLRERAS